MDIWAIMLDLFGPGQPCGTATCVDVKDKGRDGFRFVSTIEGNDGEVTYTPAEVAAFLSDVKAGKWDHLLALAEARAASELATA